MGTWGLTPEAWDALIDGTGRINDGLALFQRVLGGGVHESIRRDVWPVLLGCYPPEATREQAADAVTAAAAELKSLTSIVGTADAADRFAEGGADEQLSVALRRIGLDVDRTDPTLLSGDDRDVFMERLARLLRAYAIKDPHIGYCQGMSDLLAPFVIMYDDDGRAFLCFSALMTRVRGSFAPGQAALFAQMTQVVQLVRSADAQLGAHLAAIGADDGVWAFRMLLVMLRRETSMDGTLAFWEVLWAGQALFGGSQAALLPAAVAAFVVIEKARVLTFADATELLEMCNGARELNGPALVLAALAGGMLDASRSRGRQRRANPLAAPTESSTVLRSLFRPRKSAAVHPTTDKLAPTPSKRTEASEASAVRSVDVVSPTAGLWGACLHLGGLSTPAAAAKPTPTPWRRRRASVAGTQPQAAWRRDNLSAR
eukprot:jgi/Tetstr1/439118/TSEL_002983.t1